MVIKYPVYLSGNIQNGTLSTVLLRDNFDLKEGNWELAITTCAIQNKQVLAKKIVGITCNICNSWTQDRFRKTERKPTVLGIDILEFKALNEKKTFPGFCNNYFSFNQAEENLEIRFIDLSDHLALNANLEVFLTLVFKKTT